MSVTSFSRLATSNTFDNSLRNLQSRQTSLANLQENLTSAKRSPAPATTPPARRRLNAR